MPSRLSRMISSFAAASRPPPNPSATSARPSSCSAPVSIALAPSASAAAARSGTPIARRPRQTSPTAPPIAAPTSGNTRCARTKFGGIGPAGCGIGSRVRKATAVLRSSSQSFMTENPRNRLARDALDRESHAVRQSRRYPRVLSRPARGALSRRCPARGVAHASSIPSLPDNGRSLCDYLSRL